jgi:hypothetical protein
VNQPVHHRDICSDADLQVEICSLPYGRALPGIHDQDVAAVASLRRQHALPQYGLHFSHVVSIQAQQLGFIDIYIACCWAINAEGLYQPGGRGGSA